MNIGEYKGGMGGRCCWVVVQAGMECRCTFFSSPLVVGASQGREGGRRRAAIK